MACGLFLFGSHDCMVTALGLVCEGMFSANEKALKRGSFNGALDIL